MANLVSIRSYHFSFKVDGISDKTDSNSGDAMLAIGNKTQAEIIRVSGKGFVYYKDGKWHKVTCVRKYIR